MGRTANHAMVIAQLVIDGKGYGIHNFIVPIRGEDHLPLSGVRYELTRFMTLQFVSYAGNSFLVLRFDAL